MVLPASTCGPRRLGAPSGQVHAAGAQLLHHLAVVGLLRRRCARCAPRWGPRRAPAAVAPRWRQCIHAHRASSGQSGVARSLAVASPTWLMPRANKKRGQRGVLGFFQRGQQVLRRVVGHALELRPGSPDPGGTGRAACGSHGRRPADPPASRPGPRCPWRGGRQKCKRASLRCAAQNRPPEQRWLASPFSRTTSLPQMGHWRGMRKFWARRPGAAPEANAHHLGNHIACAAHDHLVAHAHAFFADLEQVVQRGIGYRDAAHKHRRQARHGRELAGAAHLDVDAFYAVAISCAGYLCATAQRGSRVTKPRSRCNCSAVDLVDHAVNVVGQRIAAAPTCW